MPPNFYEHHPNYLHRKHTQNKPAQKMSELLNSVWNNNCIYPVTWNLSDGSDLDVLQCLTDFEIFKEILHLVLLGVKSLSHSTFWGVISIIAWLSNLFREEIQVFSQHWHCRRHLPLVRCKIVSWLVIGYQCTHFSEHLQDIHMMAMLIKHLNYWLNEPRSFSIISPRVIARHSGVSKDEVSLYRYRNLWIRLQGGIKDIHSIHEFLTYNFKIYAEYI